jgi:hypothetical protein
VLSLRRAPNTKSEYSAPTSEQSDTHHDQLKQGSQLFILMMMKKGKDFNKGLKQCCASVVYEESMLRIRDHHGAFQNRWVPKIITALR